MHDREYRMKNAQLRSKLIGARQPHTHQAPGYHHRYYESYVNKHGAAMVEVYEHPSNVHVCLLNKRESSANLIGATLAKVEEVACQLWYAANGVPAMQELLRRYRMATSSQIVAVLGEQHLVALEKAVGNWSETMTILVNYFDRVAGVPALENLESAWRLLHMDNKYPYLVGALICAYDFDMRFLQRMGINSLNGVRWKYQLTIDDTPWLVRCQNGYVATEQLHKGPHFYPQRVVHDWTTLETMIRNEEDDKAIAALAGIGGTH